MPSINYALIGFGGIAENRIAKEGFACEAHRVPPMDKATLIGATDLNPKRREAVCALGLTWYDSAQEICQDPRIQAVYVATNNLTHVSLAEQALRAGKHVIVEKPLATTAADARRLVSLAQERKLSLSVDHMMVNNVLNQQARDLVAEGRLGTVNDACFHMEFAYGYEPEEARTWRCGNWSEMGGPIGDVASHCFYMAEYIFNTHITAVAAVYYPKLMDITVEDGAYVRFLMADGMACTARVAFNERRGGPLGTLSNLGYELYGDKAVLRGFGTMFQLSGYEDEPIRQRLVLDSFDRQETFFVKKPQNIYQSIIAQHAESILTHTPLSAEEGYRNVRLCEAAHQSARQNGKLIPLE